MLLIVVTTLLGVLAIPAVAASPAPRVGTPSSPVSRDLSTYTLFGFSSLDFKGGQNTTRGIISGGNVGTNGDANPCANGHLTMDDGTQLVANTLRATNLCNVWDIYANGTTGNPPAVPRNSGPTAFTAPVLSAPALPPFSCNPNNPITVAERHCRRTHARCVRRGEFQDNTTASLDSGVYTMCSLHTGQDVTVNVGPATTLQIAQDFVLSKGTTSVHPPSAARVACPPTPTV